MKTIFRGVSVKTRLPEKPKEILGGQQVNSISRCYGITKVVIMSDKSITIASFHYGQQKWYVEWDCRSYLVDEIKSRDVTHFITHWLEEMELPSDKEIDDECSPIPGIGTMEYRTFCEGRIEGAKWLRELIA